MNQDTLNYLAEKTNKQIDDAIVKAVLQMTVNYEIAAVVGDTVILKSIGKCL